MPSPATRAVIDGFILLYLLMAWCWRHPPGAFGRVVTEPLAGLLQWLGLTQHWTMFSPDPALVNAELEIVIKRKSGAALSWAPPRLHALSGWEAFRGFRYRAYANTMMAAWATPGRPTLAHYLLRKYDFGDDPAVEVVYTCVERPIVPPGGTAPPPAPVRSVLAVVPVPMDIK